jgi:hypothetical protein
LVSAWTTELKPGRVTDGNDDGWYTTGEVCAVADESDPRDRGALLRPALQNALGAIMPRGITPEGLGRFLSHFVDRVVGDCRLRKRKHPITRVKQYLVEQMEGTKSEAATGSRDGEFNFQPSATAS